MDNLPNLPSQEAITPSQSSLPPAKNRSRKGLRVLLGGIVLIGVIVALWYAGEGRQSNKILATISLSNQNQLHIGQSAKDAAKALGVLKLSESVNILEYPVPIDLSHPLEATIYLEENRVVGVRINRNQSNVDKQTGIHTGMTLDEVKANTSNQVQAIKQPVKYGMATGLVKNDTRIKSYYLVNACIPGDDKIRVIVIAEKGYEERALELGAGCNGRGN